jgi:ABC-type glycerol-3-phosphate transport system substrate-binding protein
LGQTNYFFSCEPGVGLWYANLTAATPTWFKAAFKPTPTTTDCLSVESTWGGWIPLSPDVAHSPTYEAYVKQNPRFQTFIDILDGPNVHAYPPVAYLGFLIDELQRAEDAALRGSKTPKEALDQLQKNVQKELAKRKEMGFDDSL